MKLERYIVKSDEPLDLSGIEERLNLAFEVYMLAVEERRKATERENSAMLEYTSLYYMRAEMVEDLKRAK